MNKDIKFSILIPSIPSRFERIEALYKKLESQISGREDVEILSFCDNKKRSIGYKRDSLVQIAQGKYLAFVDDDDDVCDDYVSEIMNHVDSDYDLIMFNSIAYLDSLECKVFVDIDNPNQEVRMEDGAYLPTLRKPFHFCAWRTEIAKQVHFANVGYGEDWDWSKRVLLKVEKHYKIEKFLHIYRFNKDVTEAPTESNAVWTNPNGE